MPFRVADLVSWSGGRIANPDSWDSTQLEKIQIERIAPLAQSRQGETAFFFSKEYQAELLQASPSVLVTGEPFIQPIQASGLPIWKKSVLLACADPYFAMAVISQKFAARISSVAHLEENYSLPAQTHPTAVIHATAEIAAGVRIGAHCVVEENAKIGKGSVLYPGCYLGPRVKVGENCVLFPNVVVYEWCEIGNRVRIHASSVIGADGFGYAPKLQKQGDAWLPVDHQKIYHLGRVVIEDDVEIGASSTIDRGTFDDTRIGPKVKIDNQVQIGHNAQLGEGTIVCGETGMAGSTSTGRYVMIAGQSGISNKVHLGDYSKIGALTLVSKDIDPGGCVVGSPAREQKDHFRLHASLNRQYLVKQKNERKPSHE